MVGPTCCCRLSSEVRLVATHAPGSGGTAQCMYESRSRREEVRDRVLDLNYLTGEGGKDCRIEVLDYDDGGLVVTVRGATPQRAVYEAAECVRHAVQNSQRS